MRELGIAGAWILEPKIFPDARGSFHEWFKGGAFEEALGHPTWTTTRSTSPRGSGTPSWR